MYYRDHCQQSTQSGLSYQSQRSLQSQQTSSTQHSEDAIPNELAKPKAEGLKMYSKMLIQQVEAKRPEGKPWKGYLPSPETETAQALVEEKIKDFIAHGSMAERQDLLDFAWQQYWEVYRRLPELWNELGLADRSGETVDPPEDGPANEPVPAPVQGIERWLRNCFGRPSLFH